MKSSLLMYPALAPSESVRIDLDEDNLKESSVPCCLFRWHVLALPLQTLFLNQENETKPQPIESS